jgi:hypothetical protein
VRLCFAGVVQASDILFGSAEIRHADATTLQTVASEVQTVSVPRSELETGYPVVDALVGAGLASSKADARRGIQGNGYSVNGEKLAAERSLGTFDLLADRFIVPPEGEEALRDDRRRLNRPPLYGGPKRAQGIHGVPEAVRSDRPGDRRWSSAGS